MLQRLVAVEVQVVTPGPRTIAARRAFAGKDAVVAVLVMLLVVCTLVSGVVASMGPLQQDALRAALRQVPADDTVVQVVSSYDTERAQEQDEAVRAALRPVVAAVGGEVVRRASTVAFDPVGGGRPWSFLSVTGSGDREVVVADRGRLPAAGGEGPVEVAVPGRAANAPQVGEPIILTSRLDDSRVSAVVVGTWLPRQGARRALGKAPASLLVAGADFDRLAARASDVRWRAVPSFDALRPDQLDELQSAAVAAEREVAAADEQGAGTLRVENPLSAVLQSRARELVAQRTLLLVPAVILLLLGAASALLVAGALSDVRRVEEGLLRSRGAGRGQLIGPTALEITVLCAVAAAVGPLLASVLLRVGDVRPVLDAGAWTAGAGAAAVCGIALVLPTLVRAFSADGGEQLSVVRRRRRSLTLLLAGGLVVLALGLAAVVGIRQFAAGLAGVTGWADGTDPLVVASPALLLLAVVTVLAMTVLPLVFRLTAGAVRTRGLALALGLRFASRAPVRTVPLALVVALASGGVAFALVSGAGQADARQGRAAYEVGADVRVAAPPASTRAGGGAERDELTRLPGVDAVAAVDRELDFVDDVPVEVLVAELDTEPIGHRLVAASSDPAGMLDRLAARSADGVPVLVTDGLAERAALDLGDRLELSVTGVPATLQVVGTAPVLPTVADGRAGLLVDTQSLPGAGSGTPGPDEWWLSIEREHVPEVAAALRGRPDLAGRVLTRDGASRRLAANPGTGGAALGDILTVAAGGALVIGGVLLCSVVLLRRRERAEQAEVLRTVGAGNRDVTGALGAEYAATTGAGALAGVAAGTVVAALTLSEMTLGPGGIPIVPAPAVQVPWAWLLLATAVLVALPLVLLLALARYDRWRGSGADPGGRA